MTIAVKKIGIDNIRGVNVLHIFYTNSLIEHSPIYTELSATVTISGSYSDGLLDYDYSYTGSNTWTRIPIVGTSGSGMDKLSAINLNGVSETVNASVGQIVAPSDNEFHMALFPTVDMNPSFVPFFDPTRPSADFALTGSWIVETSATVGTITDNSEDPPTVTDIVTNVGISTPIFTVSGTPTDPRYSVDVLQFFSSIGGTISVTIDEDVTAWTSSKWRDFRGTYSDSFTDADGVTIELSVTIG